VLAEFSNSDVLKMVEAKLADDLIVSKIKSSPGDFDTSIDGILKLKAAGASDAVIHAMVDASPTAKAVVKEASLTGSASGLIKVELRTPVRLMVDEPLSSKTSKSGQTFRLVAAEDVLVNGKTVVAKGSSGTGRITLVEKGNINVYGRVEVTVDSVRAVGGHNIPLGEWGKTQRSKRGHPSTPSWQRRRKSKCEMPNSRAGRSHPWEAGENCRSGTEENLRLQRHESDLPRRQSR
jgi:hypothetical protein